MRVIEFRCWDSARGEYLSSGKVMIQVLTGKNPKTPDGFHLDTSNFMCAEGRMILEQFTGLFYCNGRIIQAEGPLCGWDKIYAGDKFNVSGIGVCSVVIDPFYGVCFCDGGDCDPVPVIDCIAENEDIIYIGNIHEETK